MANNSKKVYNEDTLRFRYSDPNLYYGLYDYNDSSKEFHKYFDDEVQMHDIFLEMTDSKQYTFYTFSKLMDLDLENIAKDYKMSYYQIINQIRYILGKYGMINRIDRIYLEKSGIPESEWLKPVKEVIDDTSTTTHLTNAFITTVSALLLCKDDYLTFLPYIGEKRYPIILKSLNKRGYHTRSLNMDKLIDRYRSMNLLLVKDEELVQKITAFRKIYDRKLELAEETQKNNQELSDILNELAKFPVK